MSDDQKTVQSSHANNNNNNNNNNNDNNNNNKNRPISLPAVPPKSKLGQNLPNVSAKTSSVSPSPSLGQGRNFQRKTGFPLSPAERGIPKNTPDSHGQQAEREQQQHHHQH